ncbi:hypothetical protein B566_EDAN005313 [Ephemera danica]|nr:hypothetical protein B566_EDAN005313 [Ephemera danica]
MDIKDVEWFKRKIEGFPQSKKHNVDLNEFLEELKKLNRDTRSEIVAQLKFEPMFDMVIKWNNPVYAVPFYELSALIFGVSKASDIMTMFESYLIQFMGHVHTNFQDLVFSVLTQLVTERELELLASNEKLLLAAAKVLADRDLAAAMPCINFLSELSHIVPQGTRIVFCGKLGQAIQDYCLVTTVAKGSPEGLQLMDESGFLNDLQDTLIGPTAHVDQLGFANSVEIYKNLMQSQHCYDYIQKTGVISKLEERILEYGPGSMEDKVMPTLYHFFGDLGASDPDKLIRDAPNVVPKVMEIALVSLEQTHVNKAAMVMLGKVATTPKGKRYLHSNQALFDPVLEKVHEFLQSGCEDNKVAAIDVTEALVFTKSAEQSDDILEITKTWFLKCMESLKTLWTFAKEPYPSVGCTATQVFDTETANCLQSVFSLMAVLSTLPWGRITIYETPGLLEWLMNRQAACGVHPSTGSGASPEEMG